MPICLHCKATVTDAQVVLPKQGINRCPECNEPGLYRGRVGLGFVVYGIGIWARSWEDSIDFDLFTPTELRLIADDLEEQERTGQLHYPDGSGRGKAGREEAQ